MGLAAPILQPGGTRVKQWHIGRHILSLWCFSSWLGAPAARVSCGSVLGRYTGVVPDKWGAVSRHTGA